MSTLMDLMEIGRGQLVTLPRGCELLTTRPAYQRVVVPRVGSAVTTRDGRVGTAAALTLCLPGEGKPWRAWVRVVVADPEGGTTEELHPAADLKPSEWETLLVQLPAAAPRPARGEATPDPGTAADPPTDRTPW